MSDKESFYLYLLGYDPKRKKWFAADDMLGILTDNNGNVLDVTPESQSFRFLEEGLEKDIDFDNMEALGQFLRERNGEQEED